MSETVEFEINKQFKNYIVIVKTMSNCVEIWIIFCLKIDIIFVQIYFLQKI